MAKKNKKTTRQNKKSESAANQAQAEVIDKKPDTEKVKEEAPESIQDQDNTEELQQKVDELNDKYLRLYSEYDNYRKRTTREKLDLLKTASEEVTSEMLPVIDDMERAVKSAKETEDCQSVKDGFELIYHKMRSILEKKGLKAIDAVGEVFDTDFHEAITYIPAPKNKMKGKVVEEIEKGYTLNEKVIRYTKAVIGQ